MRKRRKIWQGLPSTKPLVSMTRDRTLRSRVTGNGHARFWIGGGGSNPVADHTQGQSLGGFFILSDGLLSALLIAFVYALCSMPVVALVNRGLQDYAFFKMSEEQLCARLRNPLFASGAAATPQEKMTEQRDFLSLSQDSQKRAIYREACNTYRKLQETLYSPRAVQLLSNAGDVYALA